MAGNLVLDTIEGASLDIQGQAVRRVRTGIITGLPSTDLADPLLLESAIALTGLPGSGDTYPGNPALPLARVFVVGITTNGVKVQLTYESLSGVTPTAYVVTNDNTTRYVRRNTVPGSRLPFRIGAFYATPGVSNPATDIPGDIVYQTIPVNYRILNIFKIKLGTLQNDASGTTATNANFTNYVNSAPWQGLGIGFWRISRYLTQESRYQGYFSYSISAETPVIEDWSVTEILQDQKTGRYVDPGTTGINAINALNYSYGSIFSAEGAGVARYGPFPTTSFSSIFGF